MHGNAQLNSGPTVLVAYAPRDDDLTRLVAGGIGGGARHVVVDLGDAEMVDSSTLAALRRCAGRVRSHGGRLSVVCEHPALSRLLELTLLTHSFDVFGSLDAALRTS